MFFILNNHFEQLTNKVFYDLVVDDHDSDEFEQHWGDPNFFHLISLIPGTVLNFLSAIWNRLSLYSQNLDWIQIIATYVCIIKKEIKFSEHILFKSFDI